MFASGFQTENKSLFSLVEIERKKILFWCCFYFLLLTLCTSHYQCLVILNFFSRTFEWEKNAKCCRNVWEILRDKELGLMWEFKMFPRGNLYWFLRKNLTFFLEIRWILNEKQWDFQKILKHAVEFHHKCVEFHLIAITTLNFFC